eukprot:6458255-Amphidinium_carterae.1
MKTSCSCIKCAHADVRSDVLLPERSSRPSARTTAHDSSRTCKKIVDHYEPHQRTGFAGQLLSLLAWDFRGAEIEARVEVFEREAVRYDSQSAEKIFDAMKIGNCLRQMAENALRQRMLLNATRLNTGPELKREVTSIRRARTNLGPIPTQVDSFLLDALTKG